MMQAFKILLKSFQTFTLVLIKIYEDSMSWCFTISTSQKSEANKFKLKFLVIMAANIALICHNCFIFNKRGIFLCFNCISILHETYLD